jgi:hypothetical protein
VYCLYDQNIESLIGYWNEKFKQTIQSLSVYGHRRKGRVEKGRVGITDGSAPISRPKIQRTFRRRPCVMLRRLDQRREKVHGVWKFDNITSSSSMAVHCSLRCLPIVDGKCVEFFIFFFLLNRRPRHQSMAIDGRAESKKAE